MEIKILDSTEKKKSKIKLQELISPLLVFILFIYSIYIYFTEGFYLYIEDIIAYITIALLTIIYFVKKEIYIYSLSIVYLVGIFNFYSFTPFHYHYSFSIILGGNDGLKLTIGLKVIALGLLSIHLIIFKKYFERSEKEKEIKKKDAYISEITQMKIRFTNKTNIELKEIINGNGYRKEAKEVSKELLNDRMNKKQPLN